MSKINTTETKLKQSQWSQNCQKHYVWTNSKPVGPLVSFMGVYNTRKFEFEKCQKICHHGQTLITKQITSFEFTTLAVRTS